MSSPAPVSPDVWRLITEIIGFIVAIISIIIATHKITKHIDKLGERMTVIETKAESQKERFDKLEEEFTYRSRLDYEQSKVTARKYEDQVKPTEKEQPK